MARTSAYSKQTIISTALDIVREKGENALTARNLGSALGCSTSPLFTVCGSFEEIRKEVRHEAAKVFAEYVNGALDYIPAFKEYGLRLVRFSQTEPHLYKMLFLSPEKSDAVLNSVFDQCSQDMMNEYGLSEEEVNLLGKLVWTFTCGLSMLVITGAEKYSIEEVSQLLSYQFHAVISMIKSGAKVENIVPRLRAEGEGHVLPLK